MTARVERFASATAFLERAEAFLAAREAEHTVLLGAAMATRRRERASQPPVADRAFLLVADGDGDGAPALAGMRTPARGLLLSTGDPAGIEPLAAALAVTDPDLEGVEAEVALAAAFADRWTALTGRPARRLLQERLYRLTALREPARRAAGRARDATPADRDLVARWYAAFEAEALPFDPPSDAYALADAAIGAEGRLCLLWEVDGEPVSMAAAGAFTVRGARVAPVYTPPDARGRGYGSAVTAAVTRRLLDAGRAETYLTTDLANATSNHVYLALGYEPVLDVDRYRIG